MSATPRTFAVTGGSCASPRGATTQRGKIGQHRTWESVYEWRRERVKHMLVTNLQCRYQARFANPSRKTLELVLVGAESLINKREIQQAVDRNPTLSHGAVDRWFSLQSHSGDMTAQRCIDQAVKDVELFLTRAHMPQEELTPRHGRRQGSLSKTSSTPLGATRLNNQTLSLQGQGSSQNLLRQQNARKLSHLSVKTRFTSLIKSLKEKFKTDKDVRKAFLVIDTNHNGEISHEEFITFLMKSGFMSFGDDEVDMIFSKIDHNGNGKISYEEFISRFLVQRGRQLTSIRRIIHQRLSARFNNLREAFFQLDADRSGTVDVMELHTWLSNINLRFPVEDLQLLIDSMPNKLANGMITYHEFAKGLASETGEADQYMFRKEKNTGPDRHFWGGAKHGGFGVKAGVGMINENVYLDQNA